MTKRQDLYLQRRSRSEQSDQRQPNQAKTISHQPRASPNSTPLTSRIEFPTMTGAYTHWKAPPFHGAHSSRTSRHVRKNNGHLQTRRPPEGGLCNSDDDYALAIRRSSISFPDCKKSLTQRGCLPRPDHVSKGRCGFRYLGLTFG
jgi:hypothetical protein